MSAPEKPLPSVELSMKYMSWSVKDAVTSLKDIAAQLTILNEKMEKIINKTEKQTNHIVNDGVPF